MQYLKGFIKWSIGIFFIFSGGIFLLPPINNLINSKFSHFKIVEKTNDWGRFIIAFVVFVFLINIFVPSSQMQNTDSTNAQKINPATASPENNSYIDNKNTKMISEELKISKEQSASIYKILVDCGVKDIVYIENMDGNDVKGYFVHISNANNPVRLGLTASNTVDMVIYDSWVLYENGRIKDNLNNYTISAKDLSDLKLTTMQEIRKYLNHPRTVKFKADWSSTRMENDFNLSSTVKYKNDFGQDLESPFNIQFKKTNGSFKITALSIDDKNILKETTSTKKLTAKDKKEVKEIEKLMGM